MFSLNSVAAYVGAVLKIFHFVPLNFICTIFVVVVDVFLISPVEYSSNVFVFYCSQRMVGTRNGVIGQHVT